VTSTKWSTGTPPQDVGPLDAGDQADVLKHPVPEHDKCQTSREKQDGAPPAPGPSVGWPGGGRWRPLRVRVLAGRKRKDWGTVLLSIERSRPQTG